MLIIHEHTKINLLLIFTFYIFSLLSSFNFTNLAGFPDILNYINRNGGFGTAKAPNLRHSDMT